MQSSRPTLDSRDLRTVLVQRDPFARPNMLSLSRSVVSTHPSTHDPRRRRTLARERARYGSGENLEVDEYCRAFCLKG